VSSEWVVTKMLSDDEKLVFSFVCYGEPSVTEVKKLCDFYKVPFNTTFSALCNLCYKGLVRTTYFRTRTKYSNTYWPIFFRLTDVGKEILQRNRPIIFDLLISRRLFFSNCKESVKLVLANFREGKP